MNIPTEAQEQAKVMQWSELVKGKYPELELLHHVPNGGSRGKIEAANLKRQGVKSGIPDLHLPVARNGYHSLYIEMKRQKGGRLSGAQKEKIEKLKAQGNRVEVCNGAEIAIKILKEYLNIC